MYLFTLLGNLLIMTTIWGERSLHTPMYLFLCALSISEILYTFAIVPRMLADLRSTHRSIAFVACASQMHFSFTFGFTHSFLLKDVHHFFCHVPPLVKLACGGNVSTVALGVGLVCITALLGCCLLILLSYASIIATILRIPSAEGRQKAFSTCASHLTVVVVHYGFASVVFLKSKGPQSLEGDTLMAVTYTVFTPFLSPIIFSLRNKELKSAMKKTFFPKL
ncbi:PREDICTED: olfactory receptor 10H1-like [Myotis davidii]|uniref:olfactory receptor 10H1-like n=1 Tax=Myotis davidii TaxID=225400 RepID=UPI00076749CB|nr:PREDICTED: olfactory receptor 10H1-like [Myotis davidii]